MPSVPLLWIKIQINREMTGRDGGMGRRGVSKKSTLGERGRNMVWCYICPLGGSLGVVANCCISHAHPDTEGCDHTWRKFHGHCYRYFSRRHTWEDAEKDCREHNGHLASIHSPAEQNFIRGEQKWKRVQARYGQRHCHGNRRHFSEVTFLQLSPDLPLCRDWTQRQSRSARRENSLLIWFKNDHGGSALSHTSETKDKGVNSHYHQSHFSYSLLCFNKRVKRPHAAILLRSSRLTTEFYVSTSAFLCSAAVALSFCVFH